MSSLSRRMIGLLAIATLAGACSRPGSMKPPMAGSHWWTHFPPTPAEAMGQFYAQKDPWFDQVNCPLFLAGPAVCPDLIRIVQRPDCPYRWHVIHAVGYLRCLGAGPAVQTILLDATADDKDRAGAFETLLALDRDAAIASAKDRLLFPEEVRGAMDYWLKEHPQQTPRAWSPRDRVAAMKCESQHICPE